MSGYVRIHRALIGHPAFRNDAEAMAFAWMVARAAWKPTRVRYKERGIMLRRGQLAISVRDFAVAMDRDKAWVERLLKRLKSETMIETVCETGVTVITIRNYDAFQGSQDSGETPGETAARQAQDTEQIREEVKKEKEPNGSLGAWTCPPDVDPRHWADFRRNRKTRRLTDSPTAYQGQLRALAEIADDEWPPGRLVQIAAEKGWGSINDPRKPANDRQPRSTASRNHEAFMGAVGSDPHAPF